jgi:hypothetical protein
MRLDLGNNIELVVRQKWSAPEALAAEVDDLKYLAQVQGGQPAPARDPCPTA